MNWTIDHWTNLALFVGVLIFTGMGNVQTWNEIPLHIQPPAVGAFGLAVITFIKTMYTAKPRDPNVGERRTDPLPTVPVTEKRNLGGGTTVVPAVVENPGRPVDDQHLKEKP